MDNDLLSKLAIWIRLSGALMTFANCVSGLLLIFETSETKPTKAENNLWPVAARAEYRPALEATVTLQRKSLSWRRAVCPAR